MRLNFLNVKFYLGNIVQITIGHTWVTNATKYAKTVLPKLLRYIWCVIMDIIATIDVCGSVLQAFVNNQWHMETEKAFFLPLFITTYKGCLQIKGLARRLSGSIGIRNTVDHYSETIY